MATMSRAESGATDVRQEASNSRIVALSRRPIRWSPEAVSWMAAERRLRGLGALLLVLVIAYYLRQLRVDECHCNLRVAVTEVMSGQILQVGQFLVIDIVAFAFGKAIKEHAALYRTI